MNAKPNIRAKGASPIRVLYVDDNPHDRALVWDALDSADVSFALTEAGTQAEFEDCLAHQPFDLVLSDFNILGFEGLDVLNIVRDRLPGVPVVIVTGTGSEEIAVNALRQGVDEYVIKTPQHIRHLPYTLVGAIDKCQLLEAQRRSEAELKRAKEQSELIISHNIDGMLVVDEDGVVLFANPAACELLERDEPALVGTPLGTPLAVGEPVELQLPVAEGSLRIVELRATAIDWHGRPAILAALRDVSDRHRLLEREEHLNRVLHAIRNVNQLIVRERDIDRLLADVCGALVETRGYGTAWIVLLDEAGHVRRSASGGMPGRDEDLAAAWLHDLPPCARQAAASEALAVVVIGDPEITCADCPLTDAYDRGGVMASCLARNGHCRGVMVASLPKGMPADEDEQGLFAEVAGDVAFAVRDIEMSAAHERAENELAEAKTRLEMALRAANVGLWDWKPASGELTVSQEWKSQIGYADDELAGTYEEWEDRLHPDDKDRTIEALTRYFEGKAEEYVAEFRLRHKDGSDRWIYARGEAIRDDAGRATRMLGCHVDITERKRAEAERLAMEAQLRQSQKLESIGTLAGGVAHEINNPINGIMNYAQLIRDRIEGKDETIDEFAGEIIHETERVATIVKHLLSFARQEKQSHSQARVCDVVDSTLSLLTAVMRHDQIALDVNVPVDLPDVPCRSQEIRQVVMNLVTNARDALNEKYPGHDANKKISIAASEIEMSLDISHVRPAGASLGPDGPSWVMGQESLGTNDQCPMTNDAARSETHDGPKGQMTNDAERSDANRVRAIRLTVEDHGPGIPDDVCERIFEPFYTTKPRDKGTGLGLAISYGIVKDHGGELTVESEPGEWTRFHVDLPVGD